MAERKRKEVKPRSGKQGETNDKPKKKVKESSGGNE